MSALDLSQIISQLEEACDQKSAKTRHRLERRDFMIEGNYDGLLSVAISVLQAARVSPKSNGQPPNLHLHKLNQVCLDDLDLYLLGAIHHAELPEIPEVKIPASATWADRLMLFGCALAVFLIASLLVSGVIFWIQLAFGIER